MEKLHVWQDAIDSPGDWVAWTRYWYPNNGRYTDNHKILSVSLHPQSKTLVYGTIFLDGRGDWGYVSEYERYGGKSTKTVYRKLDIPAPDESYLRKPQ